KLTADVNKDRDSLATLHDDTKKMRDSVTVDIANMKKEFQANITEAKSAKTQAENNQRAIEKIQNSFFDIFVHFEGNIEQNNKIISDIIAKLNSEGFLISGKKNIIQVGVDVTEILYYNESAEAKVRLLKQLLKEKYPDIQPRLIRKDDRNPKEILIKLKLP